MRLSNRVRDLEQRSRPVGKSIYVFQNFDQTQEQAITAHEATNGPIGDRNVVMFQWSAPQEAPCS